MSDSVIATSATEKRIGRSYRLFVPILIVLASASVVGPASVVALSSAPREQSKKEARCANDIRQRPQLSKEVALPATCYDFGVAALGEPIANLYGKLGVPDALMYSKHYGQSADRRMTTGSIVVSYLYPRNLNTALFAHGANSVTYNISTIYAKNGIIRSARVVSFAGLHAGDSKIRLFDVLGKPSVTSRFGDSMRYDPFPIEVSLVNDKITGFVIGISDADTLRPIGPGVFEIRNDNNKIIGLKMLYMNALDE